MVPRLQKGLEDADLGLLRVLLITAIVYCVAGKLILVIAAIVLVVRGRVWLFMRSPLTQFPTSRTIGRRPVAVLKKAASDLVIVGQ